jgi:hypothetical protein
MYDGPKVCILVRFDLDLFKQIRILKRTMHYELPVSQSGLWRNPPDLRNLILHLWMHYCMDHIFETADFHMD